MGNPSDFTCSSLITENMDLTKTFLRTSIDQVLSDLPEMSKQMLEETLQSLGVETSEDFRFIKEEDLLSALRPIQARKAVAAWKLTCKSVNAVIGFNLFL